MGAMEASQSAPGGAGVPVAAIHAAVAWSASARPSSWLRVMCSWIWVGCPAREGRPPVMRRRQPSSMASWSRWPWVRWSSGPVLRPRLSSTALTAAAADGRQVGVQVGVSLVVGGQPQPAAGEAVVAVTVGAGAAAEDLLGQRGQVRQPGAGGGGVEQDLAGAAPGARPGAARSSPAISRATDGEIRRPAASPAATAGWACSRRIHLAAAPAAARVVRVCQRSQDPTVT